MEININIAGEHLDSRSAAKQLRMIADMVKAGVTTADGFNIEYLGSFGFDVDFESNGPEPHTDFWDGEGNHIHASEGSVIFRKGPDKADGTPDIEQLRDKNIGLADWAKAHGGITPFMPDEDGGHEGHTH